MSVLYTWNNQILTRSATISLLNSYSPSHIELVRYRKQKWLATSLLIPIVSGIIIGGTEADRKKNKEGFAFTRAPIPFSVSIGGIVSSLVIGLSNHHYTNAINAYNSQF